jgi:hypothetical protein
MRRGEGTIRIQSAAALPAVSMGAHQLLFHNRHDATRSVYLANALLPDTDDVAITAQRRDRDQTELTIEYILRAAPATSARAWHGGIAAVMMLSLLRTRRSRSADRSRRGSRLSAR